jgi:hypothetical protein
LSSVQGSVLRNMPSTHRATFVVKSNGDYSPFPHKTNKTFPPVSAAYLIDIEARLTRRPAGRAWFGSSISQQENDRKGPGGVCDIKPPSQAAKMTRSGWNPSVAPGGGSMQPLTRT